MTGPILTNSVGPVARALGFAGLLPQAALVALIAVGRPAFHDLPPVVAFLYAGLILSFLGGMWWGFAMRRSAGQGVLAILAVVPSLLPLALAPLGTVSTAWPLIGLGIAILLTLFVDRRLVATGEAPEGWMALRVPLSLGLGALTIAAGLLAR